MPAFIKIDLVCDVCSQVGPSFARFGSSGEAILPEPWEMKEGLCVCSVTCFARRAELEELKAIPDEFIPDFSPTNYVQNLVCVLELNSTCMTRGSHNDTRHAVKMRRKWSPILPPGWVIASARERDKVHGLYGTHKAVCPVCDALRTSLTQEK